MLDSGIFTFINSKTKVDIDNYVHEYAEYIKKHQIKSYVELDMDQILGVKETRRLRDRLENLVGWRSIPVWHSIRGKQSFIDDCREYDRVCLGFYLTEGLSPALTEKYTPWFVDKAHELDCALHGLGFTKSTLLPKFHFDSVDSSTWSAGKRYGQVCTFDRAEGRIKILQKPDGVRIRSMELMERHNWKHWRLYQDYAREHLQVITR